MKESAAKTIHFVKAVENAGEQTFWTSEDGRWASQAAAHVVGTAAAAGKFIATRADLAAGRLVERRPEFRRLLTKSVARPWLGWLLVVGALIAGILIDQIGPEKRINLLALPILGLLLWNLVIYVGLLVRFVLRLFRGRPAVSRLAGWIAGISRGAVGEPLAGQGVAATFLQAWGHASLPLAGARVARFMHLAAAACAIGVIASLYFRGLVNAYLAGWESTFLDASQLHALLTMLFAAVPAFQAAAVPDVATLAAMRFPDSAGVDAAPWIHRIAGLLALLVILPRLVLALFAGWRQGWLERHFPLDLKEPYFQRLLARFGNEAARIAVLPYSTSLTPQAALNLQQVARELFGPQSEMLLAASLAFGEEDKLQLPVGADITLDLLICSLAATPEAEHHGALIRQIGAATSRRLIVLVDEAAFGQRFAGEPGRLAERRKLWSDFLEAQSVAHVLLDLGHVEVGELRRQLEACLGEGQTAGGA
jgi:hypothetical protein